MSPRETAGASHQIRQRKDLQHCKPQQFQKNLVILRAPLALTPVLLLGWGAPALPPTLHPSLELSFPWEELQLHVSCFQDPVQAEVRSHMKLLT